MENIKKYFSEFFKCKKENIDLDIESVINKTNDKNQTILHYICDKDDSDCLLLMLNELRKILPENDLKELLNKQDINGNTLAHLAAYNNNHLLVNVLYEIFGVKEIPNNQGEIVKQLSNNDTNIKNIINDIVKNVPTRNIDSPLNINVIDISFNKTFNESFNDESIKKNIDDYINMSGGAINADTEKFINQVKMKIRNMSGGARKKAEKEKEPVKEHVEKSSKKVSKGDVIHKETIEIIRNLGYTEEEAKILKAGLYAMVKQQHPELNNYDRAIKMKEWASKKKYLASIDIEEVKKAIEIHRQNKLKK